MYSNRSSLAAAPPPSSESLASSTTGVRSVGALLASDKPAQATSSSFQVFPSHHTVTAAKIITSTDQRGYIPVLEYTLREHAIMIDTETRMCHWTGIWKALGKTKADVVRLIESQPDIAGRIRKIRGGHLKVQGTWMPYEIAQELCRRVAWDIRHDLVPLFGPAFPDSCIAPGQPGFGKPVLTSPTNTSRRSSRDPQAREAARQAARAAQNNKWVDTARQAKGFVAVGENRPSPEPQEVEQVAVEEVGVALHPAPAEPPTTSKESQGYAAEDEEDAPTATEAMKAAARSATRARTTSGNWYAGGGAVRPRGPQPLSATVAPSNRYAPYHLPYAAPPYVYSSSLAYPPPPPTAYPPTTSAYPQAMLYPSPYNPTHLHPAHAHLHSHRAPSLARAPSAPNLHFTPIPTSAAPPFAQAPLFAGGTPIRRTVSEPEAQSCWIQPQPASADAEGGRLALGRGAGLFAESGLRSAPEGVERGQHGGVGTAASTSTGMRQEPMGFASSSTGSHTEHRSGLRVPQNETKLVPTEHFEGVMKATQR